MIQDKTQPAGNYGSFSRAVTPYWVIWEAHFGRVDKPLSALLRLLARTSHYLRVAPSSQQLIDSLNSAYLACWSTCILPALAGILVFLCTNSYALGPVDGEIGIAWWANDFQADLIDADIDAGSTLIYGEGWLGEKWGVRGAWYDSDLEGEAISNQTRIDLELRRKLFSASDNNFFALGAGIENIDLENGGDAQGFRVSAEGRFGVPGPLFFYGKIAWVPELGDAGNFDNISAQEIDVGIHITPLPFISLRVGYLEYELDYDDSGTGRGAGSSTSGFYLGGGFHW